MTFPNIGDEAFASKAIADRPNGSVLSYVLAMSRLDNGLVSRHTRELGVALVEAVVRAMVGRA